MKCDKCGDEKVKVHVSNGVRFACLTCALDGEPRDVWRAGESDYKFEMFDLKKYQDKAREMRDEIWRKFSEDTSKYISNESPCDDSMRERPNDANTWDGKIFVVGNSTKRIYVEFTGVKKPERDAMRCPKCRCTVNMEEPLPHEVTPDAIRWRGECDDCDADIEFYFWRSGFPGGYKPITFESGSFASGEITLYGVKEVDWDAELKKLPKRA